MRTQGVNNGTALNVDLATCLYLGRNGERCERPAQPGGFCQRHAPRHPVSVWPSLLRRAGAALLLLAFLWLVLADLLREIAAWFR